MIKVLQGWQEVGVAHNALMERQLPPHHVAQKNWDLYHLHQLVDRLPRNAAIVDLGCGNASTLIFLKAMGFTNLDGIDLSIRWPWRAKQWLTMARARSLTPPYRMRRGDLTRTPYPADHFDVGVCISTIEHGVPLEPFFAEARRILKPGAPLLITTDYWGEGVSLPNGAVADGLPWKISSQADVERLVTLGKAAGFRLLEPSQVPACGERCVVWSRQAYTFVLLVMVRDDGGSS